MAEYRSLNEATQVYALAMKMDGLSDKQIMALGGILFLSYAVETGTPEEKLTEYIKTAYPLATQEKAEKA